MEDFYNFWLEGGDLKLDVIKDTFRKKLVIKFDNNPFTDRWAQSTYTKLLDSIDSFEIYKDVTSVERLIEWEIDNYVSRVILTLTQESTTTIGRVDGMKKSTTINRICISLRRNRLIVLKQKASEYHSTRKI
jgi:hypothetical protein